MPLVFRRIETGGPRRGRGGRSKGRLNLGMQGRLVLFDRQDVIPAPGHDRLRYRLLTPHCIRRDNLVA